MNLDYKSDRSCYLKPSPSQSHYEMRKSPNQMLLTGGEGDTTMKRTKKLTIFSIVILFSLIFSLVLPISVLADDTTPPPVETPEVLPPTEVPMVAETATEAPISDEAPTTEPVINESSSIAPAVTEMPVMNEAASTDQTSDVNLTEIAGQLD